MRLGVDSYSLRWQGWDAFQLLEYAAALGLDGVQFSERGNFASLEPDYLQALRRRAEELGLYLEVGMGSFDRYSRSFRPEYGSGEEQLRTMLRVAHLLGSPVLRCFLGSQADRQGAVPLREHLAECVRTLRAVAPLARDLGVMIAVENHAGDLQGKELRWLIEEAGPDYVGACLDTGNPVWVVEDPLLAAEVLAPYVVTTHVRDSRVMPHPRGAQVQWVPMGQGNVAIGAVIDHLRARRPQVAINLEIITGMPLRVLPYFEPDFWQLFPEMLAADFARFVARTVQPPNEPFAQLEAPPGAAPDPALFERLRLQQRQHFEESVRYCRTVLGLGERGRSG